MISHPRFSLLLPNFFFNLSLSSISLPSCRSSSSSRPSWFSPYFSSFCLLFLLAFSFLHFPPPSAFSFILLLSFPIHPFVLLPHIPHLSLPPSLCPPTFLLVLILLALVFLLPPFPLLPILSSLPRFPSCAFSYISSFSSFSLWFLFSLSYLQLLSLFLLLLFSSDYFFSFSLYSSSYFPPFSFTLLFFILLLLFPHPPPLWCFSSAFFFPSAFITSSSSSSSSRSLVTSRLKIFFRFYFSTVHLTLSNSVTYA